MRLSVAKRLLRECGIEDYVGEAKTLFSEFGGFSAAQMLFDDVECDNQGLLEAIDRRIAREPLQYILGYAYFYRERYKVDERCLIPRSDTEVLVDYAVKMLPDNARFLDLCTGSGCIGISVLKNTRGTRCTMLDLSSDAIDVARINARENGVSDRAQFKVCDVGKADFEEEEKFFAILSNPPYVTEDAYKELAPEIYKEPGMAFVGGADGADFYRLIIPMYGKYLAEDGFLPSRSALIKESFL